MSSIIDRAFMILECFGRHQKPLRLSEVVTELDLPKQTASRLFKQLEALQLLERDTRQEKYRLGARVRQLGISSVISQSQTAPTRVILEDLVARFDETVNIGILDRGQVLYIDRVECHWPLRVQLAPGSRVKVHCTAIGKLLLAHLPEPIRTVTINSMTLEKFTPSTITDVGVLEKECTKIKAQGYAENIGEDLQGLVALAVPIFGENGKVIAGIAVHAPEARMNLDSMRSQLSTMNKAAEKLKLTLMA